METLPIEQIHDDFVSKLSSNRVIIVSVPTGSGKTLRLPLWCLEYVESRKSTRRIVVTEPRRIAVMTAYNNTQNLVARAWSEEDLGYAIKYVFFK